MTRFIDFVNEKFSLRAENYKDLYKWSVERIPDFWGALWDFVGIISSQKYDSVVEDLSKFPGTNWFPGAKLNFAENLLHFRDSQDALSYVNEAGFRTSLSYSELSNTVAKLAESLRSLGVKQGDRVAAYMPNRIETIVAMLASVSLGASWASCGAELGPTAVLDRIGQIKPKVLFTVEGYSYKGKTFPLLSNAQTVANDVKSIEKIVVTQSLDHPGELSRNFVSFGDFLSKGTPPLHFEQLPFSHPLYIMFSSGTTGKPKSIVQSAGGVLINHMKELILHIDLKREDTIAFITSPSWMMWNWVVSSLSVGSSMLLYDGDPNYPTWQTMWKHVQYEGVSIFGCSASYIGFLRGINAKPREEFDLSNLREIPQTGSALSEGGFDWVYSCVKRDIHLNSISGGTDINGCFAMGSPTLPVYAGEVQAPGLGMKIAAFGENGESVLDKQGELVCEAPCPSMPLYFLNDPGDKRYLDAYFAFYRERAGKNVWRHGDYVVFHSDTGGLTFYGRSDSVLKPSGVRIGTAEIYNVIEKIPWIADSLAIGQNWKSDQRIILFVQLREQGELTQGMRNTITQSLRTQASPRHVPALIFAVPGIPYTFSGKKVEVAISNLLNGRPVTNVDAISNPSVLNYYEKLIPEIRAE
jgi:acetoacetyl-CoA synthetase